MAEKLTPKQLVHFENESELHKAIQSIKCKLDDGMLEKYKPIVLTISKCRKNI